MKRQRTPFDLLTTRERDVDRALAVGHRPNEVARNQTQSIYQKLQIGTRATRSAIVTTQS